LKQLTLFILALTLTLTAEAIPQKLKLNRFSLNEVEAQKYDFEGIVKLNNCSGSLVILENQPLSSKAMVMTNGHCLGFKDFLKPGQVLQNYAVTRAMSVYDKDFKLHPLRATKVLYATMTNTDLTLYELSESYDDIFKRTNISPLTIESSPATAGLKIDIISGYWDRGYSCSIDAVVPKLKEGDWFFKDSLRYTKECNTIGGTSGSPIILKGTRSVIAINNTGNEGGTNCTIGNPCEVKPNGDVQAYKGINYGQQINDIYGCINPDFNIDLSLDTCLLPK